jgi:hypothetical protein
VFVAIISSWINTRIILDEIKDIKKHLGIPDVKSDIDNFINSENKEM